MIVEIQKDDYVTHVSDQYKKILQVETGALYTSACDIIPCAFTYEESDEDVYDYEREIIDNILNENNNTEEES